MTLHEKGVLSAYTGILMCDMAEVHKYIEKLLGRPVWTHELASETLWAQIKNKAKPDFLEIINSEEKSLWQKSNLEIGSICVTANNAEIGAAIPIAGIPLIFLMLSTAILFRMGSRR